MKHFTGILLLLLLILLSCNRLPQEQWAGGEPEIFPDYAQVTIPVNIAPLHFSLPGEQPAYALLTCGSEQISVKARKGVFHFPKKKWRKLLQTAAGDSIRIELYEQTTRGWHRYDPFYIYVANEAIDPYLVYRRIAPGFRLWNEMGIYQRDLTSFTEETILSNKLTRNNCMNCHSFRMQSPDELLFHQRSSFAGTYLSSQGKITRIQPDQPTPLTYPHWHPSGRYIAFSSNETKQDFHLSHANRIEVFDNASDIHIYDRESNQLFTDPRLCSADHLETFPAFSPDGKTLFFCSSPAKPMPESYEEIKYNLLRVPFDPATRTFGSSIDTLYNAEIEQRSAKFPRLSPDGKYLMYTLSDYGNFSIWHKDADLYLMDLASLEVDSLPQVNSPDVDSYHSWSSNSRWFVFSSRRLDGLYTRPFICYLGPDGRTGKPFLLPQKEPSYYEESLFSFNIPELVTGKVEISAYELARFTRKQ